MPVRTSSDEPIARDPATLTSRQTNGATTDSSVLRASVFDAYVELGGLDENSYIADWIFSDAAISPEELEAAHRNRVRFNHQSQVTTPRSSPHPDEKDADVADEEERHSSAFLRLLMLKRKNQQSSKKRQKKENHPPTSPSKDAPSKPPPPSRRSTGKKNAEGSDTDDGYLSSASARRRSSRFFHLGRKHKASPSEDQTGNPPPVSSSSEPAPPDSKDKEEEATPTQAIPPAEAEVPAKTDKTDQAASSAEDQSASAVPPSSFPPAPSTDKSRRRWSLFGSLPKSHKTRESSTASDKSVAGQHSKSLTTSTDHGNDVTHPAAQAEAPDPAGDPAKSDVAQESRPTSREGAHDGDKWETLSKSDALSMDLLSAAAIEHNQNMKTGSVFSRGRRRLSLQ